MFGYNRHPAWDAEGTRGCWHEDELDALESIMPGINSYGLDVIRIDGSHPDKAGPCVDCSGARPFLSLQTKLERMPDRLPTLEGSRG